MSLAGETARRLAVKRVLLAAVIAAVAACSAPTGTDRPRVKCPTSAEQGDQTLTRAQWRACFGRQDKDPSGPGS